MSLGLLALFLPLSLLTLPGFRAPSQGANDSGPKLLGREELEETAILRLDRGEAQPHDVGSCRLPKALRPGDRAGNPERFSLGRLNRKLNGLRTLEGLLAPEMGASGADIPDYSLHRATARFHDARPVNLHPIAPPPLLGNDNCIHRAPPGKVVPKPDREGVVKPSNRKQL